MLAHRSRLTPKQKQFANYLWREKGEYDFSPYQMYADESLAKLGFIQPEDVSRPDVNRSHSPAAAFRAMHKMFLKDIEDSADPRRPDLEEFVEPIIRKSGSGSL